MRLFSYRDRPVHLGPYPLERLTRQQQAPDLGALPAMHALSFDDPDPLSLTHAMRRFMGMFDLVRDGAVNAALGEVPGGAIERAQHLKAAGYFFDASMMGACRLPAAALLAEPIRNHEVTAIGVELERNQPTSFAASAGDELFFALGGRIVFTNGLGIGIGASVQIEEANARHDRDRRRAGRPEGVHREPQTPITVRPGLRPRNLVLLPVLL